MLRYIEVVRDGNLSFSFFQIPGDEIFYGGW